MIPKINMRQSTFTRRDIQSCVRSSRTKSGAGAMSMKWCSRCDRGSQTTLPVREELLDDSSQEESPCLVIQGNLLRLARIHSDERRLVRPISNESPLRTQRRLASEVRRSERQGPMNVRFRHNQSAYEPAKEAARRNPKSPRLFPLVFISEL
jgi:hypothetical protein